MGNVVFFLSVLVNLKSMQNPATKKIVFYAGLGVVVIATFFTLHFTFGSKETFQNNSPLLESVSTVKNSADRDTDSDGLKDWEEVLWGTNPTSRDTDGNGVSDKEEIAARKNNVSSSEQGENSPADPETTFIKNFVSNLSMANTLGESTDQINERLSSSFSQAAIDSEIPDKYKLSDVVTTNNEKTSLDTYYKQVADLFGRLKKLEGSKMELQILVETIENNDSSASEELAPISSLYKQLAQDGSRIPAPADLISTHLDIINSTYKIGLSIEGMGQAAEKPLSTITALVQYRKYGNILAESLEKLQLFLAKGGKINDSN